MNFIFSLVHTIFKIVTFLTRSELGVLEPYGLCYAHVMTYECTVTRDEECHRHLLAYLLYKDVYNACTHMHI